MKKLTKKLLTLLLSLILVLSGALVPAATAEEIVISGNGSDSDSEVNVTITQNTTVDQSNDANINNDINVTANTGGNTASDNAGGGTKIETGNINVSTQVTNAANTSHVSVADCCPGTGVKAVISGNLRDSENTIDYNSSNTLDINVDQDADINNDVDIDANTGDNDANDNSGDVSIKTGNIFVDNEILNKINFAKVQAARAAALDALLDIAGNGTNSINTIAFDHDTDASIEVDNDADVDNDVDLDLTTGDNSASDNTGDIKIETGDIEARIAIATVANVSMVEVLCGCKSEKEKEKEKEKTAEVLAPTAHAGGVSAPSSQPEAQVVQAAMGEMLPVTGGNWLYLILTANTLTFLTGAYLRKRGVSETQI